MLPPQLRTEVDRLTQALDTSANDLSAHNLMDVRTTVNNIELLKGAKGESRSKEAVARYAKGCVCVDVHVEDKVVDLVIKAFCVYVQHLDPLMLELLLQNLLLR